MSDVGTLRRVLRIDTAIRTDQTNGVRLAAELGVSRRTIARDLVFLREQLKAPLGLDENTLRYTTRFDAGGAILRWLSR